MLVLSNSAHNRRSGDILVAAITSNLASGATGIIISDAEMESGKLPVDSLVRADKIYTLSKGIIVKQYGRLNATSFEQVLTLLDDVLGR